MNPSDYVKGVLRTEADASSPRIFERFNDRGVFKHFIKLLETTATSCRLVDNYKKYLFYGKHAIPLGISTPDNLDPVIQAKLSPEVLRLLHAAMGLATEAGEILEQLIEHVTYGKPLDKVNLSEEGGDLLWYMGVYIDTLKTTFEAMMQQNNAKLKARYPDKFTEEAAINRDLDNERKVLEHKTYLDEHQ